ncbi:MAG: prolyl oligopeptidase family serine peptidase [Flavobacteriaceae bacterium]|nr:prolyl oligopeptidase family serine peptidase [Flavobacteriaceae bacterium]
MKFFLIFIFICCAFFNADAQQDIEESVQVEGRNRTYVIRLPKNYNDSISYPIVMVLHGAMGTGTKYSKSTKFSKIGDNEGFISIFPNGMYKSWADARGVSKASKKDVDDVKFLTKLIDKVSQEYSINSDRVYVAGISNGGFMVQTLACIVPEKFTAFASIISSLPENLSKKCSKKRNTPMLLMNGTQDNYVPFKGGEMPKFTKGGKIVSTPNTIEHWKNINQTTKLPKIKSLENIDKSDGSRVVKHTYFKDEKPQVILYKIIGGGHGVPGSHTKRNPRIFKLGYVNQDIISEQEIWNFFKQH